MDSDSIANAPASTTDKFFRSSEKKRGRKADFLDCHLWQECRTDIAGILAIRNETADRCFNRDNKIFVAMFNFSPSESVPDWPCLGVGFNDRVFDRCEYFVNPCKPVSVTLHVNCNEGRLTVESLEQSSWKEQI
mmetsp:Transcript_4554/g.5136  ORF Transcript_4554/g.5136 Transcript_4554/m.5136 type:complete len:134 (-) Transcript_4554:295-696(-)